MSDTGLIANDGMAGADRRKPPERARLGAPLRSDPSHPLPEATIVIPQHNRADLTCACIASLHVREPYTWPVIVVDDGSTPAQREIVPSRQFPGTRVIEQEHCGISAAWNRGAAAAGTSYLVFLNNDVLARGPAIERLLAPLRVGTALLSGPALRRETALPRRVLRALPTTQFLPGWCLAASRELFNQMGGFDESMRLYWSDTDFQARVLRRHSAGHEALAAMGRLPLHHLGHRTAHTVPGRRDIWERDRAAFLRKWCASEQPAVVH